MTITQLSERQKQEQYEATEKLKRELTEFLSKINKDVSSITDDTVALGNKILKEHPEHPLADRIRTILEGRDALLHMAINITPEGSAQRIMLTDQIGQHARSAFDAAVKEDVIGDLSVQLQETQEELQETKEERDNAVLLLDETRRREFESFKKALQIKHISHPKATRKDLKHVLDRYYSRITK